MARVPRDRSDRDLNRLQQIERSHGRIFAAALARLVEAYEASPERARHALEWEHLPGRGSSPHPISEEEERKLARFGHAAKAQLEGSLLHGGNKTLKEFDLLLSDWYTISSVADESSFELENLLDETTVSNWRVTGESLIPSENRLLFGWTLDDVGRLKDGDQEVVSLYRAELTEIADNLQGLRGEERNLWIEARMDDISSVVRRKLLEVRKQEFRLALSRWEQIERIRPIHVHHHEIFNIWCELDPADRPPMPPKQIDFPSHLPSEMKEVYLRLNEIQGRIWTTDDDGGLLAECEMKIEQLIAGSKAIEDGPGLARYMKENEKRREEQGRIPIPTDNSWYEYYSLEMDDDASCQLESANWEKNEVKLFAHWAKELIGVLPSVVDRSSRLGTHPFAAIGEEVPLALRTLFEQAHMLYIFDFDIPCIITCATLVEEVIESTFPDLSEKWSMKQRLERKSVRWIDKINDVVYQNPRLHGAKKPLLDIGVIRNDVVHDPAKYLNAGRNNSEEVLRKTRTVLQLIFEV